jgi:glucose dehydrogenase
MPYWLQPQLLHLHQLKLVVQAVLLNQSDQMTPLQVGNKVFLCTPHNNIFAIDADSGKQLWKAKVARSKAPSFF